MEVPGKVVKVLETHPDGESTESVVLQCYTSSGDVEDGEEVVRSEPASERLFFPTAVGEKFLPKMHVSKMRVFEESDCEEEVMVRASDVRAWLTNVANDSGEFLGGWFFFMWVVGVCTVS